MKLKFREKYRQTRNRLKTVRVFILRGKPAKEPRSL